ncbi:MAG TPA: hypothetical protein VGK67_18380 [Myxococcales bacterium]|jgi:uncharacterized protein (TIGR02646 family)
MIRVRRIRAPAVLDGPSSDGEKEAAKAIAFYSDPRNKDAKFKYTVYKHEQVEECLKQMFGPKCAYCECSYADGTPVDVEHFRPKGGVEIGGVLQKPGYYWLAAKWENLLPSCIDCNRERHHELSSGRRAKVGKGNRFPLQNEGTRVRAPGDLSGETRLLLNPCEDDPDEHLEFLDNGVVRPRRRPVAAVDKGAVSIEVFGLDRRDSFMARKQRLCLLNAELEGLRDALARLAQVPRDAYVKRNVKSRVEQVMRFIERRAPFAGACRQVVRRFLGGLGLTRAQVASLRNLGLPAFTLHPGAP